MAFYGYARINDPSKSFLDQLEAMEKSGISQDDIVLEVGPGTRIGPKLQGLLDRVRLGDKLLVSNLDRLARSTEVIGTVLKICEERGVVVAWPEDSLESEPSLEDEHGRFRAALERIVALTLAKTAEGETDFQSGPGRFFLAWLIAHEALHPEQHEDRRLTPAAPESSA